MAQADDSRTQLVRTMARLLRDQGYAGTGLAQVLAESRVSNGSLYHHFPNGMDELAEAALESSGQAVAAALSAALGGAKSTGRGVVVFLDIAATAVDGDSCAGCPIAPTALESPILNPRLRATAARLFEEWEALIAERLRLDGWPKEDVPEAASAALALIEGALLLARVSRKQTHLANAKRAALALFDKPPSAHA